jgi:hypothetical protein
MTVPFAIYFPQFHPTPTNDRAWGAGFTDWQLVEEANHSGRWAPRRPQRGYYDGSSPAVHAEQVREAREAGLGGFALYHYWFFTHQELDAFERSLLQAPAAQDCSWFLIWACEGWSRRWVGDPSPILTLSDAPTADEIERHCDHLAHCFAHPGYWRWRGRPLFIWYHPAHFRDPPQVVAAYRAALQRRGHDVAMGHFIKNPFEVRYAECMDLSYLFEPRLFFGTRRVGRGGLAKRVFDALVRMLGRERVERMLVWLDRHQQKGIRYSDEDFLRYLQSSERQALVGRIPGPVQEVLSPGWNNTPRYRDRYTALEPLAPGDVERLLRHALQRSDVPPLLNAWNEWSEGAAIEPCEFLGRRYLDVVERVVR